MRRLVCAADSSTAELCCHATSASPEIAGLNYLQSVTPNLSLGGETFWLSAAMKSGVGFAARHQGEKHIATAQLATTGLVSLNYAHRLSEKVKTLALWSTL